MPRLTAVAPPARPRAALAWALCAMLTACGGGGGDAPAPPAPPAPIATTYTVSIALNAVGAGESFRFTLGTQALVLTQAGVATPFATALASGSNYAVSQTDGPRTCTFSANRTGTIGAPVAVTADCGQPPASTALIGTLRGPLGVSVVLQNNGGDDLAATVLRSPGVTDRYDETAFSFATRQLDGSAYQVSIKTTPGGQTCSVYKGATGTMPVASTAVRAGCEHTFDLVSRGTDDAVKGSYFDSSAPVIGGAEVPVGSTLQGYGEGRFVAFVSNAAGLAGSTGAKRQVFWRDSLTGETRLISTSAAGTEGNGDSFAPAISADGLSVAFESYASNLVAGDTNGVRDVFIWRANSPSPGVTRVSVGAGAAEANAESYEPTLSGDGLVVAFSSGASNLSTGVSGINTINVYRRDLVSGATTLVTRGLGGNGVGGARPMLSEDGRHLAFHSFAADLVVGDGNGLWDIFVLDATTGGLQRVSLTAGGGERNQGTESASRVVAPALSGDGRWVAFATTASNMVGGDTNGLQDVFVVNIATGAVSRASTTASGVQGDGDSPIGQGERPSLSYDGGLVAFSTAAGNLGTSPGNVLARNLGNGALLALSSQSGGAVGAPVSSRTGAYVVFGASTALDARYPGSSGLFSRFTGLQRAWWWID